MIHENQQAYYEAINESNHVGESTIFVEFMLNMIRGVLSEIISNQNTYEDVGINLRDMDVKDKLLLLLKSNPRMTAQEAAAALGLSQRQVERVIKLLKAENRLERVGANKGGTWKVK